MDSASRRDPTPPEGTPAAPPPAEAPPAETHRPGEQLRWRRLGLTVLACGAILAGAFAGAAALRATRRAPPRQEPTARRTGVEVVQAQPQVLRPQVEGLGRSRPARRVRVAAQVGGRVVTIHPRLEDGNRIEGGVLAVEIEPDEYQNAVLRAEAKLAQGEAEVDRLAEQARFLQERLALQEKLLETERAELERLQGLLERGIIRERELEIARLAVLRGEHDLVNLRSTVALLGPQQAGAAAQVREAQAALADARLNLGRARIVVPFAGLLAVVAVEEHQLVSPGQDLFELWEVDRVEVPVSLSLPEASLLSDDLHRGGSEADGAHEARVVLDAGGVEQSWRGVLRRFEPVDPATQTVKAVVEVVNDGGSRPLVPGVFCRVFLQAPPTPARLAIPIEALQERGRAFVVREGVLHVAPLDLGRRVGGWVVVEGGLEPGDQVIVSPLERVVEGMPLAVIGAQAAAAEPAPDEEGDGDEAGEPSPQSPAIELATEASGASSPVEAGK